MFGDWLSIPVPDIERTDFLLMLGANPMVSNGSLWTVPNFRDKAKALRERGGKLIVIDPRRTETAKAVDQHIFIRPGGDVFLLLGMVHALFAEKLVRLNRLEPHVAGMDAVERAVAAFPPERTSARCEFPRRQSVRWPALWRRQSAQRFTGALALARKSTERCATG